MSQTFNMQNKNKKATTFSPQSENAPDTMSAEADDQMDQISTVKPYFDMTNLNHLYSLFLQFEKNSVILQLKEENQKLTDKELYELYLDEMQVQFVVKNKEDDISAAEYFATLIVSEFFDEIVNIVCSFKRKHIEAGFKLVNLNQLLQNIKFDKCHFFNGERHYFILKVMKSNHFNIQFKRALFEMMQDWIVKNNKSSEFYGKWTFGVYTDESTLYRNTILKVWFNDQDNFQNSKDILKHMNSNNNLSLYKVIQYSKTQSEKSQKKKNYKKSQKHEKKFENLIKC